MNKQEQQLAEQILTEALNPDTAFDNRDERIRQYCNLMSAVKTRCDAERVEVETFEIIQSLDSCEVCGDLI